MQRGQGRRFSPEKVERIKYLLATTDMTIPEIAQRMGCSGTPIVAINRKFGIRAYNNKRSSWVLLANTQPVSSELTISDN
jgi:hypothetical protein